MNQDFYLFHEKVGDQLAAAGQINDAAEAYKKALSLKPHASWIEAKRSRLYTGAAKTAPAAKQWENGDNRLDPTLRTINLFMPYYTPQDRERVDELNYCFRRNLDSGLFARIVLMIDDDSEPPQKDRCVSVLRLDRRPTYLDWVRESRKLCMGQISVLANSDIYFDDSLGRILEIFGAEPKAFIALTRFDKAGDDLIPHTHPHWSQDTWAFMPTETDDDVHDHRFDVPLGVPRCDNKIAYVFATQGYQLFNPLPHVRSIHVHETGLRYYSKKGDRRVIGGVAMAHPGAGLMDPAQLDIEVWSERSDQVADVKINRTLEHWAREAREAASPRALWLAHDADWQYPAVTERHAFEQMRAMLGDAPKVTNAIYFGFPFATLIDLHHSMGADHPRTQALQAALDQIAPTLKTYEHVFTVGQHIRAKEYGRLFAEAGVTDLFWSHCAAGKIRLQGQPWVRTYPFPLYPVQQVIRGVEDFDRPRRWLFSFVGSRAPDYYLTQSRNHIIDLLSDHPRGMVVGRDGWHYQKVVYEAQILDSAPAADGAAALINDAHSSDFNAVMDETIFALCPSGSGPNSIRLWEAMLNGAIPVIMSDDWTPPGDTALWDAASLRCAETPKAIATLPDRLEAIAAEPGRLRKMRTELRDLAQRYGPVGFVGDVIDAFESGSG